MSQDRAFYYLRFMYHTRDEQGDMSRQRWMGALELYILTYAVKSEDVKARLEEAGPITGEQVPPLVKA